MNEPKVKEFTPRGLEDVKDQNRMTIKNFTPLKFGAGETAKPYEEVKQAFGSLANTDQLSNKKFALHPDSKKYLGVEEEERSHLEAIIKKEVDARISEVTEKAYQEGFAKGEREGHAAAQVKLDQEMAPLREQFTSLMNSFEKIKEEMFFANERILVQLIYQIARHVMLKDLKEDKDYLKRLCVQMIEKIGIRDHLKIKVSKADLDGMEQLKDFLKVQYTDLKNVKIEPSDEVELGGCKIETNLIWINASIESQLKAIEESLKEQ